MKNMGNIIVDSLFFNPLIKLKQGCLIVILKLIFFSSLDFLVKIYFALISDFKILRKNYYRNY